MISASSSAAASAFIAVKQSRSSKTPRAAPDQGRLLRTPVRGETRFGRAEVGLAGEAESPANFASHNANLVVNGDAELVAWCDYRMAGDQSRGTIVGEGAIDIPGVREAIKKIMEGGEAAFHLRKAKYGF